MNKQLLMLALIGGISSSALVAAGKETVATEALVKKPVVTTTVPLNEAKKLQDQKTKAATAAPKKAEQKAAARKGRSLKAAPEEASKKVTTKELDERLAKVEKQLEQIHADHKRFEADIKKATNGSKKSAE